MAAYDREEDMLEDEEAQPRLRSTVAGSLKKKGRGFREPMEVEDRYGGGGRYETLEATTRSGPAKSVEGWVVFVSGVHEEAQEEDLHEAFAEYGDVKNIYLNLDRRTGFVKGYALIEYATKKEAQDAIDSLNGQELLTQRVSVMWAFSNDPIKKTRAVRGRR